MWRSQRSLARPKPPTLRSDRKLVVRCAVRTSKGRRLDDSNVQVLSPIGEGSFGRCFKVSRGLILAEENSNSFYTYSIFRTAFDAIHISCRYLEASTASFVFLNSRCGMGIVQLLHFNVVPLFPCTSLAFISGRSYLQRRACRLGFSVSNCLFSFSFSLLIVSVDFCFLMGTSVSLEAAMQKRKCDVTIEGP